MNSDAKKMISFAAVSLFVIGAATIFLLFRFEENIGRQFCYLAIASGVLCVFLFLVMLLLAQKNVQRPSALYVTIGMFLIVCLFICFPNPYLDKLGLVYLLAIPIAVSYGFQYALVSVVAAFALTMLIGVEASALAMELRYAMYATLSAVVASGRKERGFAWVLCLFAFVLQGILFLLTGIPPRETHRFATELIVILLYSLAIPATYYLSILREMVTEESKTLSEAERILTEETMADAEAEGFVAFSTEEKTEPVAKERPLTMEQLLLEDCEIALRMQEVAPRAFHRAKEIARFAREIADKLGENDALVYAAALYHDVDRFYKGNPKALLPEYLYNMIQRQNNKQEPISVEELIVLLSNHVLAIHHYMERNNTDISTEKVIENIFNLQLKKGNIITAGISMSLYHKMKQEFTAQFVSYLSEKKQANTLEQHGTISG